MTNNPYIGRVGAVLANEIALLAPLDVFSEFRIFGGSPMAFDGEIPLVHAVIRISLNGIGATNRGEKFFGDFKAVHRIVGLRRADHPSVLVNLDHVELWKNFLRVCCQASPALPIQTIEPSPRGSHPSRGSSKNLLAT